MSSQRLSAILISAKKASKLSADGGCWRFLEVVADEFLAAGANTLFALQQRQKSLVDLE